METPISNQAITQCGDLLLNDGSAMEPLKMELLRQTLKRGLADCGAGKLHEGDAALDAMIDADIE